MNNKTESKTAFVLRHSNLKPIEIVAKAKAAGIVITPAHVYTIRSNANAAKRNGNGAAKANGKTRAPNAEREFTRLALEIGTLRAQALLGSVRAAAGVQ